MISAIAPVGQRPAPEATRQAAVPAPEERSPEARPAEEREEVTTVTTHCTKHHRHTPECPHTTFTRPAGEFENKGRYLDVLA